MGEILGAKPVSRRFAAKRGAIFDYLKDLWNLHHIKLV